MPPFMPARGCVLLHVGTLFVASLWVHGLDGMVVIGCIPADPLSVTSTKDWEPGEGTPGTMWAGASPVRTQHSPSHA
jgi:hypothetical protein